MARVGFLGLGRMGKPMARNLLKAGHRLTVWNRSPGPAEELAAEGAVRAQSPAEVAAASEVVISCLSTPDVVEQILLQALEGAQPGTLFIDCSTIGVSDARRLAEHCARRGVEFVDAPVSGGPWGAEAGTLTLMCGGSPEALDRAEPILRAFGSRIYKLGPVGSGQVAKLCNNLLVAIHTAAAAEAFVLGTKAGLDPQVLYDIITNATGDSAQIRRNMPKFTFPGDFRPAFSVEHLTKDVGLARQLAREQGVRLLLGAVAEQVCLEAMAAGYGQADIAALIRPLEASAGVEVRVAAERTGGGG
nr:MAG: NAD(P)-dependent oxidoreductase [Bacillota bacterium]